MSILDRIKREPALVVGVVIAGIVLARAFGVAITDEQASAVQDFLWALLPLAGALVIRSQVTPTTDVAAKVDAARAEVVAGPAAEDVSTASEGDAVIVEPDPRDQYEPKHDAM